ncbi:Vacuolar protein sorting-associated protein 16 [Branchiostoma belcheri]|nr:Vacuolar protein sorting-associated protein 16 [Branchiostoma belcheri]
MGGFVGPRAGRCGRLAESRYGRSLGSALWKVRRIALWKVRRIALWKVRRIALWKIRRIALWKVRRIALWKIRSIALWKIRRIALWKARRIALWKIRRIALWKVCRIALWKVPWKRAVEVSFGGGGKMAHVTGDWNPLGQVFYRKQEIYTLGWRDIDLDKFVVAAAPYGGPVALIRDETKLVRVQGSIRPVIYIYTSSGREISSIRWNSGHVIHLGWSCSEELLCVQEDGSVLVYDIFGQFKRTFSMGTEAKEMKVRDCRIFNSHQGTGLAVMTSSYRIFMVNNVDEPRIRRMADVPGTGTPEGDPTVTLVGDPGGQSGRSSQQLDEDSAACVNMTWSGRPSQQLDEAEAVVVSGLDAPPSSWVVISQDRQSRVLLARENDLYLLDHGGQYSRQDRQSRVLLTRENDLYLLDHGGQYSRQLAPVSQQVEAYTEMAVSFNNKYLALFTNTGLLWIGSSDLERAYCEFDTKCPQRPKQLAWCGTGAIVGYWENILLMVGPGKDYVKYNVDSTVHLVPELDGLRILSNYSHEFLHKVPSVVECVFKIGSIEPGAMLYEASREFQNGSPKADEYIRMIQDRLTVAVDQCIQAAGCEHEPTTQRMLLRAALFGKCFLSDMNPEPFVRMCRTLRVLNSVRDFTIGIPLSCAQLEQLSMPVLIDRLVLRRQYPLAIRICQYLKLPEAEGVQQTHVDDELIARSINEKLRDTPGISYSEIAAKAAECGRTELAIRLLEYEPKSAEQVPLLMKMGRDQLALAKAVDSGDTDLVYTVVMHLKEKLTLGDFLMTIRNLPTAQSLYLQYCKEQNREMLQDLYYQEDNFQESANCRVMDSYNETRMDERLRNLQQAQEAYTKARNEFAAKVTEEQVRLLKYQMRLEEELKRPYLDLSLHDTISQLTTEGNHKLAEQLRKEFKVPDKRFWWLKIQALAEGSDWAELDRFAKSKKSPIGYEPFIDVCLKHQNRYEANKYVGRIADTGKVKAYIKIGNLEQAAETALQQRNEEDLNLVLSKCTSSHRVLAEKINTMKAQLSSKK